MIYYVEVIDTKTGAVIIEETINDIGNYINDKVFWYYSDRTKYKSDGNLFWHINGKFVKDTLDLLVGVKHDLALMSSTENDMKLRRSIELMVVMARTFPNGVWNIY